MTETTSTRTTETADERRMRRMDKAARNLTAAIGYDAGSLAECYRDYARQVQKIEAEYRSAA